MQRYWKREKVMVDRLRVGDLVDLAEDGCFGALTAPELDALRRVWPDHPVIRATLDEGRNSPGVRHDHRRQYDAHSRRHQRSIACRTPWKARGIGKVIWPNEWLLVLLTAIAHHTLFWISSASGAWQRAR